MSFMRSAYDANGTTSGKKPHSFLNGHYLPVEAGAYVDGQTGLAHITYRTLLRKRERL